MWLRECFALTAQPRLDLRQPRQRAFQPDQIARVRVAKTNPLDIVQTVEQFANITTQE